LLNRFGSSNSNSINSGSGQATTPLLFHRESLQSLQGGKVSIDQVRALAQGRLVIQRTKLQHNPNAPAPNLIKQDGQVDQGLDQSELMLEDLSLTPEQREGKRLMEERSAEQQQRKGQRKRSTKTSS
jgi:hypothetical protein